MNKIYIVFSIYETSYRKDKEIEAVFTTKKRAEKFIDHYVGLNNGRKNF
jgi:hypothetical protein